jgi:hypothetical protein
LIIIKIQTGKCINNFHPHSRAQRHHELAWASNACKAQRNYLESRFRKLDLV